MIPQLPLGGFGVLGTRYDEGISRPSRMARRSGTYSAGEPATKNHVRVMSPTKLRHDCSGVGRLTENRGSVRNRVNRQYKDDGPRSWYLFLADLSIPTVFRLSDIGR